MALAGAGVNINVRTALILFFVPYLGMFCYILASVKLLYTSCPAKMIIVLPLRQPRPKVLYLVAIIKYTNTSVGLVRLRLRYCRLHM